MGITITSSKSKLFTLFATNSRLENSCSPRTRSNVRTGLNRTGAGISWFWKSMNTSVFCLNIHDRTLDFLSSFQHLAQRFMFYQCVVGVAPTNLLFQTTYRKCSSKNQFVFQKQTYGVRICLHIVNVSCSDCRCCLFHRLVAMNVVNFSPHCLFLTIALVV